MIPLGGTERMTMPGLESANAARPGILERLYGLSHWGHFRHSSFGACTHGRLLPLHFYDWLWRRIGRGHKHSFTHLLDSFHDDALAEPETLLNDPEVSTSFADTHGLDDDLVVSLNDGDLIAALQFHHRALRHEQGAFRQVEPHAHSREPAWAESIVRVWELRVRFN